MLSVRMLSLNFFYDRRDQAFLLKDCQSWFLLTRSNMDGTRDESDMSAPPGRVGKTDFARPIKPLPLGVKSFRKELPP
jgi:hypothetical protein